MAQLNQYMEQWAKRLNLTSPDEEEDPYILTPVQESNIIENAKEQYRKHLAWKLSNAGYSEMEILSKLSRIVWEEVIDEKDILHQANANAWQQKIHHENRKEEKRLEKQRQEQIKANWNYKRIFALMKYNCENIFKKHFICDEFNMDILKVICFFLSEDERFETELKYSFNKGLLLRGISGTGKTFPFKCVVNNPRNPIAIHSMIDITEEVKDCGMYELSSSGIIYLDDVGTEEPVVNFFGTKIYFFKNFIERYHLNNTNYSRLIISTNCTFDELEEKYGFRVRSRFKEMFNIIDVKGPDRRK